MDEPQKVPELRDGHVGAAERIGGEAFPVVLILGKPEKIVCRLVWIRLHFIKQHFFFLFYESSYPNHLIE